MESKHTKGKWTANNFMSEASIWCADQKKGIAKLRYNHFEYDQEEVMANAAHIVKCVNAHDELVSMLTEIRNNIRFDIHIPQASTDARISAILNRLKDTAHSEV